MPILRALHDMCIDTVSPEAVLQLFAYQTCLRLSPYRM